MVIQLFSLGMSSSLALRTGYCAIANLSANELANWRRYAYLTDPATGAFRNLMDAGFWVNLVEYCAPSLGGPPVDWDSRYEAALAQAHKPPPPVSAAALEAAAMALAQRLGLGAFLRRAVRSGVGSHGSHGHSHGPRGECPSSHSHGHGSSSAHDGTDRERPSEAQAAAARAAALEETRRRVEAAFEWGASVGLGAGVPPPKGGATPDGGHAATAAASARPAASPDGGRASGESTSSPEAAAKPKGRLVDADLSPHTPARAGQAPTSAAAAATALTGGTLSSRHAPRAAAAAGGAGAEESDSGGCSSAVVANLLRAEQSGLAAGVTASAAAIAAKHMLQRELHSLD